MKSLLFLVLLVVYLHGSSTRPHSLAYFYTRSTEVPNFPEFVAVGLVDDVQFIQYDSNTSRAVSRQDWMSNVTADDLQYLDRQTQIFLSAQHVFKAAIDALKQRLNQTGGVHSFQRTYGCEWDDETGEMNGHDQLGYDGEDWTSFDLKTGTWIPAKPETAPTKPKEEQDKAFEEQTKFYLTQECPEWLKKYVDYGKSSLMRTELPSVSLLQKTPSSPVRCLATGFYPKMASLVWRRDGVEIHEDVEHGEILPNQDGTFQMSVDLDVSSVRAEDWGSLDCVFQLSGVKEDMVTRLKKDQIRTNWDASSAPVFLSRKAAVAVVGLVIGLLLLLVFTAGFIIRRRNSRGAVV